MSGSKPSGRDVAHARFEAEEALWAYAGILWLWNHPDAEHTRLQLRGLVERVIEETVPLMDAGRAASPGAEK